jgi:hypothetical protein
MKVEWQVTVASKPPALFGRPPPTGFRSMTRRLIVFWMWRPQTLDVASVVNAFHEGAESRLFLLQPKTLYLLFDNAFDPRIK